ncbi:CAP domain-containing protein [Thermodesulfovibrio sp.]|uniref:CAP domain-containing protein n=1 Tax=Thermodesulfovibrio sp. TaxID=2067987 RepID=UPI0030A99A73
MKNLIKFLLIVGIIIISYSCVTYQKVEDDRKTSTELTAFDREEMLSEHNKWRTLVGVPPLRWSTFLEEMAKDWAYKLSSIYNCRMIHRSSDYGENIYWSNFPSSPKKIVTFWANERFDYDYSTNKCKANKQCGHYTQLVWRDTREVGCGKARCSRGEEIWVCNYYPEGNITGKRPY